jgi:hypothetical protein
MRIANKFGGKGSNKIIKPLCIFLFMVITVGICKYRMSKSSICGLPANYDSIITLTGKEKIQIRWLDFKKNIINHLPIAINAKENFKDYQLKFFIPKDTTIYINAVGEAAEYLTNPYLFNSFDNDGIEVFFDMQNEKKNFFDINKDDRQYRILWKTLQMDGKNFNKTGVKVIETDPTSTTYIMEVTFPWKTLGYFSPKKNAQLGFDLSIMDSDGGSMKGKLTWNSKSDDGWKNAANYGTIVLSDEDKTPLNSKFVVATKRGLRKMTFSSKTPFYYCKNVTVGYVTDSLDLSGKFQAEWDTENLYLKIFVRDNIKTLSKVLFDYGWIEDITGKIVWTMNVDQLRYAGGALKNRRIDTAITLKKGYYYLKYHTDESHSPTKWDDQPPTTSFYGIKLSY